MTDFIQSFHIPPCLNPSHFYFTCSLSAPIFQSFLNISNSYFLCQCCSDFLVFLNLSCCRMVRFSSGTAQLRAPGSLTPSQCSTNRRCTTFPSASWGRHEVMLLEKRARRTKRWEQSRMGVSEWGVGERQEGEDWGKIAEFASNYLSPWISVPLRFLAPLMRWFPTTRITSCSW